MFLRQAVFGPVVTIFFVLCAFNAQAQTTQTSPPQGGTALSNLPIDLQAEIGQTESFDDDTGTTTWSISGDGTKCTIVVDEGMLGVTVNFTANIEITTLTSPDGSRTLPAFVCAGSTVSNTNGGDTSFVSYLFIDNGTVIHLNKFGN